MANTFWKPIEMNTSSSAFLCAHCRGWFDLGSDAEALAELKAAFGDVDPHNCVLVCDACWEIVRSPDA